MSNNINNVNINELNKIWYKSPLELFKSNVFLDFIPSSSNTLVKNINIIVKDILLFTIIGFIITKNYNILYLGIGTILITTLYYIYKIKDVNIINDLINNKDVNNHINNDMNNKEGFQIISNDIPKKIKIENTKKLKKEKKITSPSKKNPLMNVMLPQIQDEPLRPKAAQSFQKNVETQINDDVKKNIDPRLFQDLGDEMKFEHSMRQFYTTANTQIPNDQKAFAEFCYGNMISCRGGDEMACVRNNERYIKR